MQRRLIAITTAQGTAPKDLGDLCALSLAGLEAFLVVEDRESRRLTETPLFHEVERWIAAHRPDLVVLDTLADLFEGDGVNHRHARRFSNLLTRLCHQYDTTILLIANPSQSALSNCDGCSESTPWHNTVRSFLNMDICDEEGGKGIGRGERSIEVKMPSFGEVDMKLRLRWEDGVFIADAIERSVDNTGQYDKAVRVFMKLLQKHHENGRRLNIKSGKNYAPSVFAADPDAEGVTRAAFRTAMDLALQRGLVRMHTEGPPSRKRKFLVPA